MDHPVQPENDEERFPRLTFWASSPKTAHPPTQNQPLNPIHIPLPKTCAYNLPVPPSDTPAGVLARRDRRWWWGNDVSLHHRGSRKMVSLRRHGERRRVTDRPFVSRCPKERAGRACARSEEHKSELQSLMRISYAVFCLKKKIPTKK